MGQKRLILRPTSFLRKQAGQMRKLIGLWDNSKEKSIPSPIIDGKPDFLAKTRGLNQTYVTRRQIVLNRHFTEIISDILANNLKRNLDEVGATITSIETKAWNKGVRVFYSTERPFDVDIHRNLNSLITKLRAAIAERQLIGKTPMINFVYDETVRSEQELNNALSSINLPAEEKSKELVTAIRDKLGLHKLSNDSPKPQFSAKNFSAPQDMSNTILGFDYPKYYNQVAARLERGRAESARMPSNVTLASDAGFLKPPVTYRDDVDPMERIMNMQKFVIRQKKKSEYLAKQRRKQELLSRNEYQWDLPEEENGTEDSL